MLRWPSMGGGAVSSPRTIFSLWRVPALTGLLLGLSAVLHAQELSGRYDFASLIAERGPLWAMLIAFGAGVLVSFTPCVYPMIPITVGIIGARSETPSLRRSFGLSLTYVFGLVVVYSVLGLLVALLGAQIRSVIMGPYVLVAVAVVFGVLALGMLGLYELQLPPALASRLSAVGGKGYVGVLLMGMVSGLVASPCTAAPLAGILTYVAVKANPLLGFLLLFSFAWGMGLLLVVVGTSAGALTRLPRSGEWMLDVKRLFGFIFLAVAAYFIRTLVPEMVYFIAIAACLIAGGIAFGALDSIAEPSTGRRIRKGVGVLLMVLGFYVLLGTLWNHGVFLPERREPPLPTAVGVPTPDRGQAAEASAPLDWQTDVFGTFEAARADGRRVLIDWSADWCDACKEMEKEAFSRADVRQALAEYELLRVDVTDMDAKEEKLADRYKFLAPPTLIVADGEGATVGKLEGYESPQAVLAFLRNPESLAPKEPSDTDEAEVEPTPGST